MVAGWVQPSHEKHRKSLESFTDELYHSNKIGGYKFGKANSASFHFFSLKQLISDPNLKNLEFKIRLKDLNDKPSLIFFLTTKQKTNEPSLEPDIMDVYESTKSDEIIDLNKKSEIIEKIEDLASPLTNEEKSPELTKPSSQNQGEKNDYDIEEIIKKMDSNKQQPLFEEKPLTNKSIFEQANIQAEELTPIREGEEEEKPLNIESLVELNKSNNNQESDFNDIIEELQKMKPDELKEFVASFEPDSRGKIANFLKDISKDEGPNIGKSDSFEGQVNPPLQQNTPGGMPGFYNPIYQQPQQQQQPQPQQFYQHQNMGYMQGAGGYNRPGKLYQPNNTMRQQGFNRFGGNKQMYGQYNSGQMYMI